ncbi:MAG TPA: hypothetical protein VHZ97_01660 [Pseudonocardiaceae bacterium]|jgi:hypothetical protein|nr:hypothetical protein [Pseudonocardiaceae bacterium]
MSSPVASARARLFGLLCAAALLAGCTTASTAGTPRTHSARTTVPASASTTAKVDTAFSASALRTVDPCGLLDQKTLSQLGKPSARVNQNQIDACSADLDDGSGKSLNVEVVIGDDLASSTPTGTIAGLPVKEESDSTECAENLITQHNPTTGIEVRAVYTGTASCVYARQLAGLVVNRIRTNAPHRPSGVNSLVLIDPCDTIAESDVENLTAVGPDKSVEGLFKCDWLAGGYDLSVQFTLDGNPKDETFEGTPQPVDVGVPAYAFPSNDVFPSCDVKWQVRTVTPAGSGDDEQGEVVDVQFGNVLGGTADPCTQAEVAAKLVATKVPHGS